MFASIDLLHKALTPAAIHHARTPYVTLLMGALIVSRYPRHPIGWLLSAGGSVAAVSLTSEAYSLWATDHEGWLTMDATATLR